MRACVLACERLHRSTVYLVDMKLVNRDAGQSDRQTERAGEMFEEGARVRPRIGRHAHSVELGLWQRGGGVLSSELPRWRAPEHQLRRIKTLPQQHLQWWGVCLQARDVVLELEIDSPHVSSLLSQDYHAVPCRALDGEYGFCK